MDEQKVAYMDMAVLAIKKNEVQVLKTLCSVEESRYKKTNIFWCLLREVSGICKFLEAESSMGVFRDPWQG